ncbi:hypothetical protein KKC59_01600, partial [bacterium]|nr:hypothetical protein [bacterium]
MKRLLFIIFLVFWFTPSFLSADVVWQKNSKGIDVVCAKICASNFNDEILLAGGENIVYKTVNKGNDWKKLKTLDNDEVIVDIAASLDDDVMFVATNKKLYSVKDKGLALAKIFEITNFLKDKILCVQTDPLNLKNLYVGTGDGLFVSYNLGILWEKVGSTKNLVVEKVVVAPSGIFLATDKGILKSDNNGKSWVEIYSFRDNQNEEVDSEEEFDVDAQEEDGDASSSVVKSFFEKNNVLYVTAGNKILSSVDYKSFQDFYSAGLPLDAVNDVVYGLDLTAFTTKGVFVFNNKENLWKELYKGMDAKIIFSGCYSKNRDLFCTGDTGIYLKMFVDFEILNDGILDEIDKYFSYEPSINEVQKKAVHYAEVSKEKIDEWRRLAKKRNIMPEVDL